MKLLACKLKFKIEQHIGDSDIDIDTMAQELAVSRSQLNHKLKHILGVTPSEMIREARIRHAAHLAAKTRHAGSESKPSLSDPFGQGGFGNSCSLRSFLLGGMILA